MERVLSDEFGPEVGPSPFPAYRHTVDLPSLFTLSTKTRVVVSAIMIQFLRMANAEATSNMVGLSPQPTRMYTHFPPTYLCILLPIYAISR